MSATQQGQGEEILTLPEAAAFLRVSEDALAALAAEEAIPARKIGNDWRFLKRALTDWLRYGPAFYREWKSFPPPWMFDYPPVEEWLRLLEKRLLDKLASSPEQPPKPGSKQAVLKHFGIFKDDPDIDEFLAGIYRRRQDVETKE